MTALGVAASSEPDEKPGLGIVAFVDEEILKLGFEWVGMIVRDRCDLEPLALQRLCDSFSIADSIGEARRQPSLLPRYPYTPSSPHPFRTGAEIVE